MLDPVPMEIETSSDEIICLSAAVVLEAWSDQDPADDLDLSLGEFYYGGYDINC